MSKTRRKFTDAFKAEAVELVINSGRPAAEIARDLGVILSVPVDHGGYVDGRVVDGVADAAA